MKKMYLPPSSVEDTQRVAGLIGKSLHVFTAPQSVGDHFEHLAAGHICQCFLGLYDRQREDIPLASNSLSKFIFHLLRINKLQLELGNVLTHCRRVIKNARQIASIPLTGMAIAIGVIFQQMLMQLRRAWVHPCCPDVLHDA